MQNNAFFCFYILFYLTLPCKSNKNDFDKIGQFFKFCSIFPPQLRTNKGENIHYGLQR